MSIILRGVKGSPLTYNELDGNFVFLSQSYAVITGSNTFVGDQTIQGNLSVFGTASFTFTTSSITTISASTFAVSISSPVIRYGLYEVLDSGASTSTSSLAWDSLNKYWIYKNATGSVTSSAILLTGPISTGGLGTEASIPQYRIPMSNGDQSLVSSNIYSSGSTNIITGSVTAIGSDNTALITAKDIASDSVGFAVNSGNVNKGFFWYAQPIDRLAIGAGGVGSLFMSSSNSGTNGFFSFNKQTSNAPIDILGNTIITGSLNVTAGVTGNLTGTSSYASFALTASHATNVPTTSSYALQALSSSYALTASYVLNAVSASYILNAVSASFATTSSYILNAVSASTALTASSLRPLSQSVVLTGSLNIRNTAAITTFTTIGRSGSLYIDLNGVGNNYIDGNALFIRNSTGITNLVTISGSTTTINTTTIISGSTIITGSLGVSGSITTNSSLTATGSLGINKADGSILLLATSSVSSSSSSSIELTTASFTGTGFLNTNSGGQQWDSNFDIYYSGISGSGETQISPVYAATADLLGYNDFRFGFSSGGNEQIILSPSGSIQSYKIYIYDSGSSNGGPRWYVKSAIDSNTLESGITVTLSNNTNTNFGNDLINTAGFGTTSDPTSNTNTITYISGTLQSFSSSLVEVNAPFTVTGSLGVSGSTTFIGTHILSGSNTIIGNTVLSGSIIVSGSTTFANTTFTVTGSQFYTGSSVYVGNQTITGSLSLTSDGIGTGLFINGQKQFNYISVYHTASILPTQNVSGSFIYSTVTTSSGISVVSGSRITFANTGIYNLQFSAQLFTQTGATVDIWFKKNGVNIANSATKIGPTGNNTYHVPAWNFVDTFTSGSYVELAYQSDQTNTQFQYIAATGNIPAIPSIILSVTQVA